MKIVSYEDVLIVFQSVSQLMCHIPTAFSHLFGCWCFFSFYSSVRTCSVGFIHTSAKVPGCRVPGRGLTIPAPPGLSAGWFCIRVLPSSARGVLTLCCICVLDGVASFLHVSTCLCAGGLLPRTRTF